MKHVSVLLHEAIDGLGIKDGDIFVDGTLGSGGHSAEVCRIYGDKVRIIGFDLDGDARKRALTKVFETGCTMTAIAANFRDIKQSLSDIGITHIDRALFDLGISSVQLDDSQRGFSFQRDEPLLMTMREDPDAETVTASIVVNDWSEETIADILYGFGEETFARRIAKAIVGRRKVKPIATTKDLADIVTLAIPARYRRGRIHPATKTFQAIRIAVNEELASLEKGLSDAFAILNPGGRIAIITFHSLEDRIVKHAFRKYSDDGTAILITKKPVVPAAQEIKDNNRARSAKLRILEKK